VSVWVRRAILCAGPLLGLVAGRLVCAGAIDARITTLLADAVAAPTKAAAEAKLREAELLFQSARARLDELTRGFLTADIKRTRGRMLAMAWQRAGAKDPDRATLRDKARRSLLVALDEYARLQKLSEDKADAIERRLGTADPAENKQWREACGSISRANYAQAWTNYTLGMLATKAEREAYLKKALERFVGFTADGYRKHPIITDCFLGHALCLYELKRHFEITRLLEKATPRNTPPGTYKRMTYLLLKAYKALSDPGPSLKLEEAAKRYFDSLPAGHKHDGVELDMALTRARNLGALAKAMPAYAARFQMRLDKVARLVYSYGEPWCSQFARALGKSAGGKSFTCLVRAREHFTAQKFEQAIAEANKGIAAADAKSSTVLLADLRYTKAAACWNLKRWRDAHLAAFEFLQHHRSDRRAPEMCRRALQAALNARKARPPLAAADFIRFLNFAERNFAREPEVQKAPWYRATLLLESKQYQRAEQALRRILPRSKLYRQAQYGLALAAYRQAEAAAEAKHGDAEALTRLLARAATAVSRSLDALSGDLREDERPLVKSAATLALATVRRLLALPVPDHATALGLLGRTESLRDLGDEVVAQRLALRIEANVLARRTDVATKLIDALLERGTIDPHLAQAFANVADPLEREYERLENATRYDEAKGLGRKLVRIYTLLLRHVSRSPDKRVRAQGISVRRRLARGLQRLGDHKKAIPHYKRLVAKVPRETSGDVLRGLAVAYEHTRSYEAAIATWRVLSRGLKQKSDEWFEARYHLIRCYLRAGRRDQARKLLDYLKLQCPRLEAGKWTGQFKKLDQELSKDDPATPASSS